MGGVSGRVRAASNLWITFRADGTLRLELLVDWYTLLGVAECRVEDPEGIARTLAAWSLRPAAEPTPRFANGRATRSQDFGVGFLAASPHDRAALGSIRGRQEAFRELFGEPRPGSTEQGEADCRRMARVLVTAFLRYRAIAHERLAGGAYLPVLRAQLARCQALGDDPAGYRVLEHSLLPIREDEQYLRLAEDEQARGLIAAIDAEVARLYGVCMSAER